MAQANVHDSAVRSREPMRLSIDACKADDVSLMEQAISIASQPDCRYDVQAVVHRGLRSAVRRGAFHVLKYLLDRGADVRPVTPSSLFSDDDTPAPSQEMLEILVGHGWDINTQGSRHTSWPLLWLVVQDPDLVRWCVDHGARVDIPEDPPRVNAVGIESRSGLPRPTILGMAATWGSVETFELLRAKGAPLDPRTLHRAVTQATALAPAETTDDKMSYAHRMAMLRHLVDVLKLDVNAVHHQLGSRCSTPLCCVAGRHPTKQDHRELIRFLLDRGADPDLVPAPQDGINWPSPITCAQSRGNVRFLDAVHEWQTRTKGDGPD